MMVASPIVDERFAIERGTWADYQALSVFHYKADDPGVASRVYRCRFICPTVVGRYLARRDAGQVVGVQVVSMPHAGCTMRDFATGGRYRGVDLTTGTIMLNREIRTLSRTIVHPQFRGLGLATRLVRYALDEATTPYLESIAAMGRVHPFLERAGMTRYDPPIRAEHARLIDALQRARLQPHDLADATKVGERLRALSEVDHRWLQRELRIFRRKACMKRNHVHPEADIETLVRAARDQVLARPVYYLWWRDGEGEEMS